MDWLPACMLDDQGGIMLSGQACFWGVDPIGIIGTALAVAGFVVARIVWFYRKTRQILKPTPGWPLHTNLPRLPGNYVARHEQAELQRRLDGGRGAVLTAAIAGMGGVGKTTLALGTAHAMRDRFAGLWHVPAASVEPLTASLKALGAALELQPCGNADEDARAALRHISASGQPWLLIFDNADDTALVRPFLQAVSGKCRVLITSRNADWDEWSRLDLDRMTPDEARQMLDDGLAGKRREDRADLDRLAKRLDYWPLALTAAIGYLRVHQSASVADYLADFDARRAELLKLDWSQSAYVDPARPETLSIPAAIRLSTDRLDPQDRELLSVLSFLNPDDLWPEMIADGAESEAQNPSGDAQMPEILAGGAAPIRAGFDRLANLSLIGHRDGTWQMHRLLGEIWRTGLPDGERWSEIAARLVDASVPWGFGSEHRWAVYDRLTGQARALMEAGAKSLAAARVFHQIGGYLLTRGTRAEDIAFAAAAVAILSEKQPGTEQHATSLNNLSLFQKNAGKLADALASLEEVRRVREGHEKIGVRHPSYATTLNNIAGVYQEMRSFDKAKPLYHEALDIDTNALGPDHPNTISRHRNLGALYYDWARTEDGENRDRLREKERQFKTQSLRLSVATLGPRDQDTAVDNNNVAVMYHQEGEAAQAVQHLRQAAAIFLDVQGAGHNRTLACVRDYLILATEDGQTDDDAIASLVQTAGDLRRAHRNWGQAKLAELWQRYGGEGSFTPERKPDLAAAVDAWVRRMRSDDAPDEAVYWLDDELSSALFAAELPVDLPDSFHTALREAREALEQGG